MVKKYIWLLVVTVGLLYASVQAMAPEVQFPANATLPQKKGFLRVLVPPCPIANNATEVRVMAALAEWNAVNRPQNPALMVQLPFVPAIQGQQPGQEAAAPVGFFDRLNTYEKLAFVASILALYNIAVDLNEKKGFCLFKQEPEQSLCRTSARFSENDVVGKNFYTLCVAVAVAIFYGKKLITPR